MNIQQQFFLIYCAWDGFHMKRKILDKRPRSGPFHSNDDHKNELNSVHFPTIRLPSSLYSPIWRHVSASFKTENFKWISYITHSPHATMNRSINLSAGAKPARQAHTLTSFSTVWKSPYYHQHIRNHSAFQMFDMNQAACHKLRLDIKQISISSHRCCKSSTFMNSRFFLHSPGVSETQRPLDAVRTVGENKKGQRYTHHVSLHCFPGAGTQAQFPVSFGKITVNYKVGVI